MIARRLLLEILRYFRLKLVTYKLYGLVKNFLFENLYVLSENDTSLKIVSKLGEFLSQILHDKLKLANVFCSEADTLNNSIELSPELCSHILGASVVIENFCLSSKLATRNVLLYVHSIQSALDIVPLLCLSSQFRRICIVVDCELSSLEVVDLLNDSNNDFPYFEGDVVLFTGSIENSIILELFSSSEIFVVNSPEISSFVSELIVESLRSNSGLLYSISCPVPSQSLKIVPDVISRYDSYIYQWCDVSLDMKIEIEDMTKEKSSKCEDKEYKAWSKSISRDDEKEEFDAPSKEIDFQWHYDESKEKRTEYDRADYKLSSDDSRYCDEKPLKRCYLYSEKSVAYEDIMCDDRSSCFSGDNSL